MNTVLANPIPGASLGNPKKRSSTKSPADRYSKVGRRRIALGDITNKCQANKKIPITKPCHQLPPKRETVIPVHVPSTGLARKQTQTKVVDNHRKDPQMVEEYALHIDRHMHNLETRNPVGQIQFRNAEVTPGMRAILVDWLVQVHHQFSLHQETLYLGVGILDRYMAKVAAQKKELQLIGVTSLFLAAKYEEIYPPEIGKFIFIILFKFMPLVQLFYF